MILRWEVLPHALVFCLGLLLVAADSSAAVLGWGRDDQGQLGLKRSIVEGAPVLVGDEGWVDGKQVVQVSNGGTHTLALTADGCVYAWGDNDCGQLGNGSLRPEKVPAQVPMGAFGGKQVAGVSAGWQSSYAWSEDGAVFAWGDSEFGQCGQFAEHVTTPSRILSGALETQSVKKLVSGNSFVMALCQSGEVVVWGYNHGGQLGDGTTTNNAVPSVVLSGEEPEPLVAMDVSAGNFHALAVLEDGRLFSWGWHAWGGLGRGGSYLVPGAVEFSESFGGRKVRQAVAGYVHTLILADDGSLFACGNNNGAYTYLGNEDDAREQYTFTPVAVRMQEFGGRTIVQLAAGAGHSLALADDGSLYAWGKSSLGHPFLSSIQVPVEVPESGARLGRKASRLASGVRSNTQHVVTEDGRLIGWGSNSLGQVGVGEPWRDEPANLMLLDQAGGVRLEASKSRTYLSLEDPGDPSSSMVYALDPTASFRKRFLKSQQGLEGVQLAAGEDHVLMLDGDGRIYATGGNDSGQLGNGTTVGGNAVVEVSRAGALAGKEGAQVAAGLGFSVVRTRDGGLFSWGKNDRGQLGNGGVASVTEPVAVAAGGVLAGIVPAWIAAGDRHVLVVSTDGRLFAWGANEGGQLGDGTTEDRLSPVEVPRTGELEGRILTRAWAGSTHSVVMDSSGRLFAWGSNQRGQLGVGFESVQELEAVPVVMAGDLAGKSVVKVAAGLDCTLILCADGTVCGMGDNRYGVLALEDRLDRAEPTAMADAVLLSSRRITDLSLGKGGQHVLAVTQAVDAPELGVIGMLPESKEGFSEGGLRLGPSVGYETSGQLRLSNLGNEALVISQASIEGPDASSFTMTGTFPRTLLPGEMGLSALSLTISVSASVRQHARLRLVTNDPACPELWADLNLGYADVRSLEPMPDVITVNQGFPAELSASIVADAGCRFRWTRATSPSLVLSVRRDFLLKRARLEDAGDYKLEIYSPSTGDFRYLASTQLVVKATPWISRQPVSVSGPAGGSALFSVAATTPSGVIGYQWYHDDQPLAGANQAELTLSPLRPDMQGRYRVELTNGQGTVSSEQATLNVSLGAPVQAGLISELAFEGEPAVLHSQCFGTAPLQVEWSRSGRLIRGATGLSYSPSSRMSSAVMGRYSYQASNSLSSVPFSSTTGWLGMMKRAPSTASVVSGKTIYLSCTASCPAGAALAYEWRFNGASMSGLPGVQGRDGRTLKISPVSAAHAGVYACQITMTSPEGSVVRSHGDTRLTVFDVPSLTPESLVLAPVRVGQRVSVPLFGLKNPDRYSASGLPPGLVLNKTTGMITGRPLAARIDKGANVPYKVRLTAANAAGSTVHEVDWLVLPFFESVVGQCYGLVARDPAINGLAGLACGLGGRLEIVVTKSGASSGFLTLGSDRHALKGDWILASAHAAPRCVYVIKRKAPLAPLSLPLVMDPASGELQNDSEQPVSVLLTARFMRPEASRAGAYNAVFERATIEAKDAPAGNGIVSLNLNTTGLVKWTGRLAEGTSFTASSGRAEAGHVPVHLLLHGGRGSLQGWVRLDAASELSGNLDWAKAADQKSPSYPAGFELHTLYLSGARYMRPVSGNLMGYAVSELNSLLTLTGESLGAAISQPVTLTEAQGMRVPGNPDGVKLTLQPGTGWFSGSFNPATEPNRGGIIQGILLPGAGTGHGFFLQPGKVEPSKVSGMLRLGPN